MDNIDMWNIYFLCLFCFFFFLVSLLADFSFRWKSNMVIFLKFLWWNDFLKEIFLCFFGFKSILVKHEEQRSKALEKCDGRRVSCISSSTTWVLLRYKEVTTQTGCQIWESEIFLATQVQNTDVSGASMFTNNPRLVSKVQKHLQSELVLSFEKCRVIRSLLIMIKSVLWNS